MQPGLLMLAHANKSVRESCRREASDLTEAVKATLYEDYLQAYSESNR
jgi:hypothetical protein